MINTFLNAPGHHCRRCSGPLGLFSSLWCSTAAASECQHTQEHDGALESLCLLLGKVGGHHFSSYFRQLDHRAALPAVGQILPGRMWLESVQKQTSVRHVWILLLPCKDLQEGTQLWLLLANSPLPCKPHASGKWAEWMQNDAAWIWQTKAPGQQSFPTQGTS